MKKTILFALVVGLLSACSIDPTIEYSIDPYLASYLETFYKEGEARGLTFEREALIMKFDESITVVDETHPGVSIPGNRQRAVYFHPMIRDYAFSKREIVIFHELGHALLKKGHSEDPKSLMYFKPDLNIDFQDSLIRKEKLDELFKLGK
jgi:hypothetical protein